MIIYRNSRTWGTGRQGRTLGSRQGQRLRVGRQQADIDNDIAIVAARCGECGPGERETGAVCGTDHRDYESACQLRQVSCGLLRRQGGSLSRISFS